MEELHDVATSKFGLRVLHYLVLQRNPRIFNKELVELLKLGDSNLHSKKEPEIRRLELLKYVEYSYFTLKNFMSTTCMSMSTTSIEFVPITFYDAFF